MILSLENKTAVVCGSTQGIGLAIAQGLANAGCSCILLSRNEEKLQQALSTLSTNKNQNHNYFVADFNDTDQIKKISKQISDNFQPQILINNTGGPKPGAITQATEENFEQAFKQHLVCNQILATALLPTMQQQQYGRIINITSTSVKIPLNNLGVSNTIRAAVASWAKTLSNEIGKYNITVNTILPGFTDTERLNSLIQTIATDKGATVEQVRQDMIASIPLNRIGLSEEIANAAVFLASPAASYITGITLPVDGGRTGTI